MSEFVGCKPNVATCKKCGSKNVSCKYEYFTSGADLESVEWIHTCYSCGHVDNKFQSGCYGYDWDYSCPLSKLYKIYTGAKIIAESYDFMGNTTKAREIICESQDHGNLIELITELVELLKNESSNIRVGAVEALGTIPEANRSFVINALIAVLGDQVQRDYSYGGLYSDEDDMRTPGQCAANILGQWKAKDAIMPMINILSNNRIWPWNLIACIKALGKIKAMEAIPALRKLTSCDVTATWGVYSLSEKVHIGELAQKTIDLILTEI